MRGDDRESLTHTPTWAVAAVCVVFVILSLLVERGIHRLGKFFLKNKQKPLYEALQKMKEELMLLGFISLLLTVARNPISRFCMPETWSDHMLPCDLFGSDSPGAVNGTPASSPGASENVYLNRRLLLVDNLGLSAPSPVLQAHTVHRVLVEGASQAQQCKEGYVPLFSPESLHQLHIFIFVMAVVHVFYSCLTMLLGFTQLRSWRKWEEETCVENYDCVDGIRKSFRLHRHNTFVTSRAGGNSWCPSLFGSWVASFFRQFGSAVTKSDYLSLRMGFIKTHNASKKFNFHVYMMRTLEDDFKTVVGISAYLWIFVIIFMILNVHGWYAYFWISFVPILINMIIGTKLQHIITQLAQESAQSHIDISVPIKPRDGLFWFNKPNLLLYLIHFVLFQNAFELAFSIWLLFSFGVHSCLIDKHGFIIIRVVVGFLAQVLCSYSTLPLYALVTQMGSSYKKAIFDEPLKNAIYGWRSKAKESGRNRQKKSFEVPRNSTTRQPLHSSFELLGEVDLFSSAESSMHDPKNVLEEVLPVTKGHQHVDIEIPPDVKADDEPLKLQIGEERRAGEEDTPVMMLQHVRNLQTHTLERKGTFQPVTAAAASLGRMKSPHLDRSRSNLDISTRFPAGPLSDYSLTDSDMEMIPLQPRKERILFERSTSMRNAPRHQPP